MISPGNAPGRLARFIRDRRREIVEDWERSALAVPGARELDRPALLDWIPELLDRIADMAEDVADGRVPCLPREDAERHALDRLHEGFDLEQVVQELAALRESIAGTLARDGLAASLADDLRVVNRAIDRAITQSVARYTEARERALRALDRIAQATVETENLDDLLARLVQVVAETTPAVDTAAILLREGERLRIRASVGLEEDIAAGTSVAMGESFSGSIAASGRPLELHAAASHPLVTGISVEKRGVKALYGVPLVDDGEVIGVAHMASVTAPRFSEQDKRVLGAMASRATSAIRQRLLRDDAGRARAESVRASAVVDAFLSSALVGFGVVDTGLRYVRVNDALAELNGVPADAHPGRTIHEVLGPSAGAVEPILRRIMATGEPVADLELPVELPPGSGNVRTFLANYFPIRTSSGEVLGIGAAVVEITERKQMEHELRENEARFRTLADNIPQLAWMADGSGSIYWYNQRWFDFTGTTPEEVRGWGWQRVHHPDHVDRVVEKIRRSFASGEVWEDTFPLRGKDGLYRWFLSRAVPIRDESGMIVRWFGTNTDVTEQQLLADVTAALSRSLDHREALAKMAQVVVPTLADWCTVDLRIGERELERVALVHTDPAKVAIAEEYRQKYPPRRDAPAGVVRVIRSGEPEWVEELDDEQITRLGFDPEQGRLLRALGLRSYVIVPLVARGRTLGTIGIVAAESERRYDRHAVEFLLELAGRAAIVVDNARLYTEARRATRSREEILAVVSHDLRSPLGTVVLSAQVLDRQAADASTRELAQRIQRNARQMEHLIGDLLDLGSIQAGRLAIGRQPHDAAALVAEALEPHEATIAAKGLRLVQALDLAGTTIVCDRQRLLQVFSNLLGNAVKFSRPGDEIRVAARAEANALLVEVCDTGPGIRREDLPHVFEPYWSAKRHATKGTGLGLYIAKAIVEAHGGRIDVESADGGGATFRFTLPLRAP